MDAGTAALLIALAASVWTGYQEVRFWKMCQTCPYYQFAMREESAQEKNI